MLEQNGNLFSGEDRGLNQQTKLENKKIHRVKSLWIENFRGILSLEKRLNTDADVVLITGPNGFGKTSLIDALCLLLTGHYYPERRPLVTISKDGQKDSALIKADVLFSDGIVSEPGVIKVQIKNKQGAIPEISGFIWPKDIPGEILVRSSFFYQDLLNRLFDEDGAEETLRDFLAPPPREIKEARDALKKALDRLREKENKFFELPGIPSEEDIKSRREQAVKMFSEAWAKISSTADSLGITFPQRSEGWLFVIRSGNLRSGWQGELRNLANELLEAFPTENIGPLPENTEPMYSLQRIEMLLQNVEVNIASKLENKKQLLMLVNSLPAQSVVPEEKSLEEEEQKLEEYKNEIHLLKKELNVLEDLERHFQNPHGPGLLDVLIAIRDYGRQWLSPPVNDLKNFKPPVCVLQWLENALKLFYVEEMGLDEHLAGWQETIKARRIQTRDVISEKEQHYKTKSNAIEIFRKIYGLAANSAEIKFALAEAKQRNEGFISRESLMAFLSDDNSNKNVFFDEPEKILASVHEAVSKWIEVEKIERQREDALRRTQGYDRARESLDAIREALKVESNKRTSLIEKVLELPEKEIERFAKLVNQVFIVFRTVKGLCPVRFELGRRGKGSTQVNTWDILTDDRRPFGALSTGQKAQLGLSLLISLNVTLGHLIPHRIIALDDTTTALDMAQLPREASLLRQIAYGSSSDDLSFRRQLFIVSHHEDLTHRLIDFLIPPEGRSMHILNIVDWSLENGPKIEQLKVEPALSAKEKTKSHFIHLLCSGVRAD